MDIHEFGERVHGIEYREREAVYALIPDGNGEIAVISTSRGYFLPGGGLEVEETLEECLHREMLEETGYKIHIDKFIGTAVLYEYSPRVKEYIKGTGHFYLVSLKEKICEPKEEDHNLVWLEMKAASKTMVLPHQAWAIYQIKLKNR